MTTPTAEERGAAFRALHEQQGAFVIPNPWDAGSARVLAGLGFKALATTSSGHAFTFGRTDGAVTCDEICQHIRDLVAATPLPVSADLENCFSHDPGEAAETIRLAGEAGASGGSIEDWSGPENDEIYALSHAVERVEAAVEAARALPHPFLLTARAENLIRNRLDLDDTIARLVAFEKAGADVLYAPGLRTAEDVARVCAAVSKPVNVLALPGLNVAAIDRAGGKRISVGGALARAAVGGFLDAARELVETGGFDALGDAPGFAEINELMSK